MVVKCEMMEQNGRTYLRDGARIGSPFFYAQTPGTDSFPDVYCACHGKTFVLFTIEQERGRKELGAKCRKCGLEGRIW